MRLPSFSKGLASLFVKLDLMHKNNFASTNETLSTPFRVYADLKGRHNKGNLKRFVDEKKTCSFYTFIHSLTSLLVSGFLPFNIK